MPGRAERILEEIWITRYTALGMAEPDPETMCKGQCEGTGWVPVHRDDPDPIFRKAWEEAEKENPSDDGWHFVKCPDCGGSGRRDTKALAESLLKLLEFNGLVTGMATSVLGCFYLKEGDCVRGCAEEEVGRWSGCPFGEDLKSCHCFMPVDLLLHGPK